MTARSTLAALLLWLLAAEAAWGHDLGASEAHLTEELGGRYTLIAYIPTSLAHLIVEPRLPDRCALADDPRARRQNGQVRYVFDCGGAPLTVDDILVLPWKREGILLSAHWHDGTSASRFFTARSGLITVALSSLQAGSGSLGDAALRYTLLGIDHILFGIDHLLFIFGLLLIVRSPWMLVKTITAFTIAHSITLGLATLGFVDVPSGPVEAGIALSIVFVAAEGLREGAQGLALRRPWCAAFAFGLLHGFGFAGALSELGLPAREIPVALLFFNLGVEIGQIMFVGVMLGIRYGFGQLAFRWPRWIRAIPGYAIGTIAMVWLIERMGAMIQT
jgi:hypothetical protein